MRQPISFGKYLLLERISVGGMAEVFKAKSFGVEGFEKIIAIKRILPTMAEDRDFIDMFIDEAKIAGQLSHANICQIFELGKIGDSHFIAMEFVWGKDILQMQNRFRRKRQFMPCGMAAFIASKACEGLDYAHRKKDPTGRPLNIIHRDVSPQNVLVSYEGEVKIIDFGIAKAASRSSKTQAGVLKGKFGYMSPEQVRGLPLDRRSDLFAIGTILYEMLTSERLFLGESDFSTLERVRNVDIQPPSVLNRNIPPALEKIVLKALSKDPDDRYQWANEMQEDLVSFLMSQEPVFTVKQLSAWMKEAFQKELEKERQLLEIYKRVSQDDSDEDAEELDEEDIESLAANEEKTVISDSGFAPDLAAASEIGPATVGLRKSQGPVEDFGEEGATEIWGEVAARNEAAVPDDASLPSAATVILDQDSRPQPAQAASAVATAVAARGAAAAAGNGGAAARPFTPPAPPPGRADAPPKVNETLLGVGIKPVVPVGATPVPMPAASPSGAVPLAYAPPVSSPVPSPAATPVLPLVPALGSTPGAQALERSGSGSRVAVPVRRPRSGLATDVAIGVLLALLVVGAGAAGYWFLIRRPPARVADVEQSGSLLVAAADGVPAEVWLNGERKGVVPANDPLKLEGLVPGEYEVVARRKGAPDFTARVKVDARGTELVMARFAPAAPATLKLEVATEGATVLVDRQEVSAESLREPLQLAPGVPHEIVIRHSDYETQTLAVNLQPGQTETRRIELARAGVAAADRGAGGTPAAPRSPPTTPDRADRGTPDRDEPRTPTRAEAPERPARVETPERPARVETPERPARVETPERPARVETPERPARVETRTPVKVEPRKPPDEPRSPDRDSQPAAAADVGYLIANTTPWAKVLIDNKDTGKMTPIAPRAKIPLKPGKHTVTFLVGGKKFSYPILIEAGKDHRLIKELPVE